MNRKRTLTAIAVSAVAGVLAGSAVATTPGQKQHGQPTVSTPSVQTTPQTTPTGVTQTTAGGGPTGTVTTPGETTGGQPTGGGTKGGAAGGPTGGAPARGGEAEQPSLFRAARGALPFTGFQAAIALLGGAGAVAAGAALRRGTRRRNG